MGNALRSTLENGRSGRRVRSWIRLAVRACALMALVVSDGAGAARAQPRDQPAGPGGRTANQAPVARSSSNAETRANRVLPGDNLTFRPTVVVRRGTSQGSGTIIASIEGEALVLTAAHVVKAAGPIFVELHRYNLGREHTPPAPGSWPRLIHATLAASDIGADLAILRIEKLGVLPYVARLASDRGQLAPDSSVISVGIDLGTRLTSWTTQLVKTVRFELNDSRVERPFLITTHTPEHGRSGGGLFLTNGELVGVCVGHAPLVEGKSMGVFASRESIHQLLDDHDHLAALIVRSERRRARSTGRSPDTNVAGQARAPESPPVTPTRSVLAKILADDQP
jgi:S1-C subfamily serine protease